MRDREPTVRSRELGEGLRRAMERARLTGKQVAHQLDWSPSWVSRLLSASAVPANCTSRRSSGCAESPAPSASGCSPCARTSTTPAGCRVEDRVAARLARQRLLSRQPPARFTFFIQEFVLRLPVAGLR